MPSWRRPLRSPPAIAVPAESIELVMGLPVLELAGMTMLLTTETMAKPPVWPSEEFDDGFPLWPSELSCYHHALNVPFASSSRSA
jgi:hypothetical protein